MTKRVLVAGASGGIGSAVIARLRNSGESVFGVDRETFDITLPGGAEEAVDRAVSEMGGLDGVVHAVGMSGRRLGDGSITECTNEAWSEVFRVNLESAFRLLRASIPALGPDGGSIVLVGSALATSLDRDFLTVAYATAKSALLTLARSAAFASAENGVRVNVVSPGLVQTPMAIRAIASPEVSPRIPSLQPLLGRAQTADEVAAAVEWLLSDSSAGMSGAALPLDGGWTLH